MTERGHERLGTRLLPVLSGLTVLLSVPFLLRPEIVWADLNLPLELGSAALAVAVFAHGCFVLSPRNAFAILLLAMSTGWIAEALGLASTFPFGARYGYHPDLAPVLPGGVPLFIPLAWYVITYAPFVLLRGLRVRHGGRLRLDRVVLKVVLAGVLVCGVDLLLDPLAVSVGAWQWEGGGPYFQTPLSNYAGWLGVGAFAALVQIPWSEPARWAVARKLDLVFAWLGLLLLALATIALTTRVGSVVPAVVALPLLLPGGVVFLRTHRSTGRPDRSSADDA